MDSYTLQTVGHVHMDCMAFFLSRDVILMVVIAYFCCTWYNILITVVLLF